MPALIDRDDEAYFLSLKRLMPKLAQRKTEFHIGLAHRYDLKGTLRTCRMRVAARVLGTGDFSIATECGLGRKNLEDFESILEVLRVAACADPG